MINEQFTTGVQNIENQISNRHAPQQFLAHFLTAQTLLQRAKRQRASSLASLTRQIAPRHNFAVENHVLLEPRKRLRKFRKRFRDVVSGARKKTHLTARAMRLRANPVVLVFNPRILEVAERLLRRLCRAGQHKAKRMEQAHLYLAE